MKTSLNRFDGEFPFQVLMETTSYCNLRCVMCSRKHIKMKLGIMDENLKKKVIDDIAENDANTRFWFCYFGEPLLLKTRNSFFESIKYAKSKGIKTTIINSNANLLDKEAVKKLIENGLDEIYIGIDAFTPNTYKKIRVGGNYNKVMKNIDYLLSQVTNNCPKVVMQFGVYEENEREVDDFKKYWESRNIEVFIRPKLTWTGYIKEKYRSNEERYPCPWIFDTLAIDFDGSVPYCVCDAENRMPVGDINRQSIKEVWKGKIKEYQKIHLRREWGKLPEFCRNCRDWQTKPFYEFIKKLMNELP